MIQAANKPRDHRDTRTADSCEQRADLRNTDGACLLELQRVEPSSDLALAARGLVFRHELADCRPAADPFAREQEHAVRSQEDRGRERLREQGAQRVFERDTGDSGGDARDDQQPRHPLVGRLELPAPERVEERPNDADPVVAEVHEQRDRRGDMERNDECQVEGLAGGLRVDEMIPTEPGRYEHGMPQAGDREQLGDALEQADHDRLEIAHAHPPSLRHPLRVLTTTRVVASSTTTVIECK